MTYKIKWPASPHALYVTINDIVRDGRRRPFEIFINTKNLEHYAWTVALTRMISAIFRRGGDVTFVAEELKAVFDPEGGRWMAGRYVPSLLAAIGDVIEEHMIRIGFLLPDGGSADLNSAAAPRLRTASQETASEATASQDARHQDARHQDARHQDSGAQGGPAATFGRHSLDEPPADPARSSGPPHTAAAQPDRHPDAPPQRSAQLSPQIPPQLSGARVCPRCGSRSLRRIEGCWTCATCQYSHCG